MKISNRKNIVAWACRKCGKIDWADTKEQLAKPEHTSYHGVDIGNCEGKMIPLYHLHSTVWRDFKKEPPVYRHTSDGEATEYIFVSDGFNMAVASYKIHKNILLNGLENKWEEWDVAGVCGYEWEFDMDVKYWMPLPKLPEKEKT